MHLPDPQVARRFAADLDALVGRDERLGLAVSGGPDSLALLLLAAAARPGSIAAATVDHRLRPESAGEADLVADLCRALGVPHATLVAEWSEAPATAVQERARDERYRLLGRWAQAEGLGAVLTAHHADDQAETLLMRLNRGSGIRGLAAIRPKAPLPGSSGLPLVRPLLRWRRADLESICVAAGVEPVNDPSNCDPAYERVRVRKALAEAGWPDREALARSAAHLAAADDALEWAVEQEWSRAVESREGTILYRPSDAPREIRRRIVERAIAALASEGRQEPIRGRELDRLLEAVEAGATATLRGVRGSGGAEWRFSPAAPRRP